MDLRRDCITSCRCVHGRFRGDDETEGAEQGLPVIIGESSSSASQHVRIDLVVRRRIEVVDRQQHQRCDDEPEFADLSLSGKWRERLRLLRDVLPSHILYGEIRTPLVVEGSELDRAPLPQQPPCVVGDRRESLHIFNERNEVIWLMIGETVLGNPAFWDREQDQYDKTCPDSRKDVAMRRVWAPSMTECRHSGASFDKNT